MYSTMSLSLGAFAPPSFPSASSSNAGGRAVAQHRATAFAAAASDTATATADTATAVADKLKDQRRSVSING